MKRSIDTLTSDSHTLIVACRTSFRAEEFLQSKATVVCVAGRDVHPLNVDLHYVLRQEIATRSIHRLALVVDGTATEAGMASVSQHPAFGYEGPFPFIDFINQRTVLEQFVAQHANTLLSLHFIRKKVNEGTLRLMGYLFDPKLCMAEEVYCNGWSINSAFDAN